MQSPKPSGGLRRRRRFIFVFNEFLYRAYSFNWLGKYSTMSIDHLSLTENGVRSPLMRDGEVLLLKNKNKILSFFPSRPHTHKHGTRTHSINTKQHSAMRVWRHTKFVRKQSISLLARCRALGHVGLWQNKHTQQTLSHMPLGKMYMYKYGIM